MPQDLTDAARAIASGHDTALRQIESCIAAADASANRCAFIRRFDPMARAAAAAVDAARGAGAPVPPLAGLAVSIKDLFDVAGQPTTAGSRSLHDASAAARDSVAVARLRQAGAALVGHTNLSEFAFSGVGINPHHGTPANPATAALDPTARIPGGSTSGGAVTVATGAAWAALGSDTGGSIRIPAALQGLVGFKNTARLTPAQGCWPLSTTLDTVCAITRSVRDALTLHELLARRRVQPVRRPLAAMRLGVPEGLLLEGLDPHVAMAFDRALSRLSRAGARIDRLCLPPLAGLPALQAGGGFPAAESWARHRGRLAEREAAYDPRVALRIRRGATMGAADYIDLLQARAGWIDAMEAALGGFDAVLSPTVPIVAPPLEPLISDDQAFFATNALLLRNPSIVNLLDGCALSLPCQAPGDWPVGLMVWGPALADDAVLGASLLIEAALAA